MRRARQTHAHWERLKQIIKEGGDMAKVFRPSSRESSILSKIESSKEQERRRAIKAIPDHLDALSVQVASKLVENKLVETTSQNSLEAGIKKCLDELTQAEDFDIDYKVADMRNLTSNPHIVSLYLTAYVIEDLIKHKDVIDIYGSDEDIYGCIHRQVCRQLP